MSADPVRRRVPTEAERIADARTAGHAPIPAVDILDITQPWLALCASCDAGLPAPCSHPGGDYRIVMAALAEEVRRARAEAARYAEALDNAACAAMTGTDDTLRPGIRSIVARVRPEAIALWEAQP